MSKAAEFFSRKWQRRAMILAAVVLALPAGGCAAPQTAPRSNIYRPAAAPAAADASQPLPIPAQSAAFAQFTAPAADMQSPAYFQAVRQAAALASARHYKYFLLAQQPTIAASAAAPPPRDPVLGISYGRQPYGFGDAGGEYGPPGLGLAVSPALFANLFHRRQKTDAPAQWLVYMLNEPSRRAALALFAGSPPPAGTMLIYRAAAPAAPPIALRLR